MVYSLAPAALCAGAAMWQFRDDGGRLLLSLLAACVCWTTCLQWLVSGLLQGGGDNKVVNRFWLVGVANYVLFIVVLFTAGHLNGPEPVLVGFAANQALMVLLGLNWLPPSGESRSPAVSSPVVMRLARQSFLAGSGLVDKMSLDSLVVGAFLGSRVLGDTESPHRLRMCR